MLEPKNKHNITAENYYSEEVGKEYLSVHALMTYLKDPSLFYLKQNGHLKGTSSGSANAGRLFHAFMETEDAFVEELKAICKEAFKTGRKKLSDEEIVTELMLDLEAFDPKADYVDVWGFIKDNWDKRHDIWNDNEYEKEMILVGEIGDAPFKGRLDKLKIVDDVAYMYDYKTLGAKSFYGRWYDGEQSHEMTFIEQYNYDLQMTAYAELVKQNFPQVKDVMITFGVFVKSGKHEFSEYPYGLINTETVNVKDLSTVRFEGGTPLKVLWDKSRLAYECMHMDYDTFVKRYGKTMMTELVFSKDSTSTLPIHEFKLK